MSENAVACTTAEVYSEAEVQASSQPVVLPVLEKQASARLLDLLNNQGPNGRALSTKEEEAAPPERSYVTWKTPGGLSPNKRFGTPSTGLIRASSALPPEDVAANPVIHNTAPAISAFALAQQPQTTDAADVAPEGFGPGAQAPRPRMPVERHAGPANGMAKQSSVVLGPGDRATMPYLDRHTPPRGNSGGRSPFPSAFTQDTGGMDRASSATLHRLDGQPSSSLFMQDWPPPTMMGADRQHSTKLGGLERQPSNSPLQLERQPSESILAAVGQQLPSPDSPPAQDTHVGTAFKRSPASQLGSAGTMPFKGHGPTRGPLQPFTARGLDGSTGFGRSAALPRKAPDPFPPGVPKIAPLLKTSSALPPYFGPVPSSSITDIAETSSLKRTASLNNIGAQMPIASSMGRQPSSPIPLMALKDIEGIQVHGLPQPGPTPDANPRPPSTPPGVAPQSIGIGKGKETDAESKEGSPGPGPADTQATDPLKGSWEKGSPPPDAWSAGTPPPSVPSAGWEQASPPAGAGSEVTVPQSFASSPFASLSQGPVGGAISDPTGGRRRSETPPPASPPCDDPTSKVTQEGPDSSFITGHLPSPFDEFTNTAEDGSGGAGASHQAEMASAGLSAGGDPSAVMNVEDLAAMLGSTLGLNAGGEAEGAQDTHGGQKPLSADVLRQQGEENKMQGLEALLNSAPPPSPGSLNGFGGDLGANLAAGKRMVHSSSRESLPGALLQGAGGSVGEEQLQALLTSRLSGNVPPPPPLPGSPYQAGMGGRGPQGRGAPLAPEIFQPIPGGLPSRSSMSTQLGVQRGRPNPRQGVGAQAMQNVVQQRYNRMVELGYKLYTLNRPSYVNQHLQAGVQNGEYTQQDIQVVTAAYNRAAQEAKQSNAALAQARQQQQQQQARQQMMALPDTSKVLLAIQQITNQKTICEVEFTTLERTIGSLPITAMNTPHVVSAIARRQKLAGDIAVCTAKVQQLAEVYRAVTERQTEEELRKMQIAQLIQNRQLQQQQQAAAAVQAHRDMIEQNALLQRVVQQQQAQAQAEAQAQAQQQAAQMMLAQHQQQQQQQQHQNLVNDQYQQLLRDHLNMVGGGASNVAAPHLNDGAILAASIRTANPSPAPAPPLGALPPGMAFPPAPQRVVPASKFPISDMPPRMVQDPALAQNFNMQANNGRRSPMWGQRDAPQPTLPQQQPMHPTLPTTWSIGSGDTPKLGPVGPTAPLNQGPGLRLVPDGSLAPPTSIAMPSFGPLFTYQSQGSVDGAPGAPAISRGPSPAPQNNAGLHMLWGPSPGNQQGGNMWGAPDIGGTSKAPGAGTGLGPLDFGPTFKSQDSGTGAMGGGWGELKAAGAYQSSTGGGEAGPPRDEFDASKFGFFGSLGKSAGGPLDELEPADSKEGQEECDAASWVLEEV